MTLSDQSLVEKIRAGDALAASQLYERYAARVFGLVQTQMAQRLRASTEPEDLVQSIFKSVFRGMNTGSYDAPPGGTLWHLIAVISVNKVKRNGRRRQALIRDERRTEFHDDLDQSFVSHRLSYEQMESAITESLECLADIEREVVILRLKGFTVEEISAQTSKSRRTVERLLQHARQTLTKELCGDDIAVPGSDLTAGQSTPQGQEL